MLKIRHARVIQVVIKRLEQCRRAEAESDGGYCVVKDKIHKFFGNSDLFSVDKKHRHGDKNAYRDHNTVKVGTYCFAEYGYDGEQDEKLIQCLAERKNKIKLSKFPLGVVTLDGKVIGQEIPYFQNTITLDEYFETNNNVDLIRTYKAIFEILKELYDNGIYYLDIHPKNFVIDKQLNIEIIDFMYNYMNFDFLSDANKNLYFSKLREMIDYFNQTQGIDLKVGKFKSVDNFDDAYIQVDEIEKKLKK